MLCIVCNATREESQPYFGEIRLGHRPLSFLDMERQKAYLCHWCYEDKIQIHLQKHFEKRIEDNRVYEEKCRLHNEACDKKDEEYRKSIPRVYRYADDRIYYHKNLPLCTYVDVFYYYLCTFYSLLCGFLVMVGVQGSK